MSDEELKLSLLHLANGDTEHAQRMLDWLRPNLEDAQAVREVNAYIGGRVDGYEQAIAALTPEAPTTDAPPVDAEPPPVIEAEPAPILRADVPNDAETFSAPSGETFTVVGGETRLVVSDEAALAAISEAAPAEAYSGAHEAPEPVTGSDAQVFAHGMIRDAEKHQDDKPGFRLWPKAAPKRETQEA